MLVANASSGTYQPLHWDCVEYTLVLISGKGDPRGRGSQGEVCSEGSNDVPGVLDGLGMVTTENRI